MYQSLSDNEQWDAIQANIASVEGNSALGGCIFGGAFSFGMEEAGFDVAGHLELSDLVLGVVPSRQRWPVAVSTVDGWKAFAGRLRSDGTVPDVLYCNPPCVAFAGTGKHLGSTDARMCYVRYCSYEMAFALQPTVWAWELVEGVWGKERGTLDAMAYRAKRLGYRCWAFLTTSAIHGGYQNRRRFHFVASRVHLDWDGVYAREPEGRKSSKTLSEALISVDAARINAASLHGSMKFEEAVARPPLDLLPNDHDLYKGAFRDIMPFCPPGSHLRDVHPDLMEAHYRPRGRHWKPGSGLPGFGHTRGRLDRPSPNVMGGHTIIHPTEDRYLTPRECAVVQGFPMDFAFSNGTKAYAEIGKGLCTHNAAFLGRVIADGLDRSIPDGPTLADEPGHESSYLQVVDWRNVTRRLKLKMTKNVQADWFRDRHPDLAVRV